MKTSIFAAAGIAIAALSVSAVPAEAGPFDKIKKVKKKAEKKVKEVREVERAVDSITRGSFSTGGSTSNSPRTARAPGHAGNAGPAPARFTGQLSCANLGIGNAFLARDGEYTFSQGISTETRGGLIDRVDVQPSNGCFFPGLGVGDVLYVEFDRSKYKRNDYKIQCVSYDGSEQLDQTNGPRAGNYKGKDVMLHTGHSLGYTPTATGTNSNRSGQYDKHLAKRGRAMETFNFAALHTDKRGTDFYCQWFNKNTGKSALALTFRRGPAG